MERRELVFGQSGVCGSAITPPPGLRRRRCPAADSARTTVMRSMAATGRTVILATQPAGVEIVLGHRAAVAAHLERLVWRAAAQPAFLPVGGRAAPRGGGGRASTAPGRWRRTARPLRSRGRPAPGSPSCATDTAGAPRRVGRGGDVRLQRPAVGLARDEADALGEPGPWVCRTPGPMRRPARCRRRRATLPGHRAEGAARERAGCDESGEQTVRRLEQLRQIGGRRVVESQG